MNEVLHGRRLAEAWKELSSVCLLVISGISESESGSQESNADGAWALVD